MINSEESYETTNRYSYVLDHVGYAIGPCSCCEKIRLVSTMARACALCRLAHPGPFYIRQIDAPRIKVPAWCAELYIKSRRFLGLWPYANQRQNVVFAKQIRLKRLSASPKDTQGLQRASHPSSQPSGSTSSVRSSGQ